MEIINELPLKVITPDQGYSSLPIQPTFLKKAFKEQELLLLRGFDFSSDDFKSLSETFCDKFFVAGVRYKNRLVDDKDCYTVPIKNFTILGHSEGDYKPANYHPRFCFFWCLIPPCEAGGQTVIADGVKFLEELSNKTKEKLMQNRIRYDTVWNKQRWQNEFPVKSIQALKKHLNCIPNVTYKIDKETLHMRYIKSAIRSVRVNGIYKQSFSNGILSRLPKINHPSYQNIDIYSELPPQHHSKFNIKLNVFSEPTTQLFFENGEKISDEIINELIDTYDKLSYLHTWKKNDVLIFDNVRYLHGRVETEKACVRHIISKFGF